MLQIIKFCVLLIVLQLVTNDLFAQNADSIIEIDSAFDEVEEDTTIATFTFAEQTTEPLVGTTAFLKAINKELKYPTEARKAGIQGKVFVQFVVEKNGKLTNFTVVRGLGLGCDKSALNAVKKVASSPKGKWKPFSGRGKFKRLRYILPITFKL